MGSVKQNAARLSIAITVALTAAKLAVGLWTGSLAILAEAAHGLVDVAATVMTFYAVRLSDKPADDEHPYGHGKVEPLVALAETAFLFLVSGIVINEAVSRLTHDAHAVAVTPLMAGLMVVVIIVDAWRVVVLRRIAEETGSAALASGALHFASDLAASLVVVTGLLFVWLGYPKADAIAAIAVAILICVMSWRLGRRTVDALMDAAPRGAAEAIASAVGRVPGVVAVAAIRARDAGTGVHADVRVKVSRTLPLERVAAIKAEVAEAARRAFPNTDPAVTADPIALDDETVLERVHVIARNETLSVHHVTVQHLRTLPGEDRLSIGLDLELDGAMTLAEAHETASRLEAAIRAELGPQTEVETHLEPMQVETLAGADCDPAETSLLASRLATLAAGHGTITDVHNVRARATQAGLIVHYHCRALPGRTIAEVHAAVDALERQFRGAFPLVVRVVGHAEPVRPDATA